MIRLEALMPAGSVTLHLIERLGHRRRRVGCRRRVRVARGRERGGGAQREHEGNHPREQQRAREQEAGRDSTHGSPRSNRQVLGQGADHGLAHELRQQAALLTESPSVTLVNPSSGARQRLMRGEREGVRSRWDGLCAADGNSSGESRSLWWG